MAIRTWGSTPPDTELGSARTLESTRQARRIQPPRWRDLRLVVGVLLVLLSVAGGVRLVSSFDDTVAVYAAARDLVPGQPVDTSDLVPVHVRMGDQLASYVDGSTSLAEETHLLHAVRAGELVPAAALGTARQALDRSVNVPVSTESVQGLAAGAVVDLWVSRRDGSAVGEAYQDPELLLAGAVVDTVPSSGGGLGSAIGRSGVQVVVPADDVGAVIAAVDQGARLTLVPAPRPPVEVDG